MGNIYIYRASIVNSPPPYYVWVISQSCSYKSPIQSDKQGNQKTGAHLPTWISAWHGAHCTLSLEGPQRRHTPSLESPEVHRACCLFLDLLLQCT